MICVAHNLVKQKLILIDRVVHTFDMKLQLTHLSCLTVL